MKLDGSDFEIFDLPPRFAQDRAELDARWKALQLEAHPDRFATQGEAAQRVAMQWSLRINEAHRRLKDPVERATQLCTLHGHAPQAETHTAMPAAFLVQQMDWREQLEAAATPERVEALGADVAALRRHLLAELAAAIDAHADWPAAAARVRELMFVARFAEEIERRLEALGA